jgi:hypothetical protein
VPEYSSRVTEVAGGWFRLEILESDRALFSGRVDTRARAERICKRYLKQLRGQDTGPASFTEHPWKGAA